MNAPRSATLYSRDILALAVELAGCPLDPAAPLQGEARSRTCGSTGRLSASVQDGVLSEVGMKVSACAIGQAAAAIFLAAAAGRSREELAQAEAALVSWLAGDGARPDWPRLAMLDPALPHPARHGAILLPWRAALDALSKGGEGG